MKLFTKIIATLLIAIQLSACGTILHPERKGQIDGRLDPGIVLLDAVGLLFFFVPGVIAFAVDFTNGTIYLPGSRSTQLTDEELDEIAGNSGVDLQALQKIVNEVSPDSVDLSKAPLQLHQLKSASELREQFRLYGAPQVATL